jgi:PhnB protein
MTGQRPTSLTPHLFVRDTDAAVAFYRAAFGAAELLRNSLPDGRVLFVELAVGLARLLQRGDAIVERAGAVHHWRQPGVAAHRGGRPRRGRPAGRRRRRGGGDAGAGDVLGERYGVLCDPFGHRWAISIAREQLTPRRHHPPHPARRLPDPRSPPPSVQAHTSPNGPAAAWSGHR